MAGIEYERIFPRVHSRALGGAIGVTTAVGVFLLTILQVVAGPQGLQVGLLTHYFYGYDVTWAGAFIGAAWAAAVGFVAGWLLVSLLELSLLLALGHGLLLTMDKGTDHRTGLDLLGAGALVAVGLNELLSRGEEEAVPGWAAKLDRFCAMPLLPLLALSALVQVISPDDVFLYAKAGGSLLSAGFDRPEEVVAVLLFCLATGLLLMLPLAGLLLVGQERLQPWLERGKAWLYARADTLVGLVSLALAVYLGVQGVEGLRLS